MDWKFHIEWLLSAGATVDQLAAGMGVTPNAVREIRAGRTRSPRADAAFRLAAMKPGELGTSAKDIGLEADSRMSNRALRAKLGMDSDKHLATLLQLPLEEVAAWPEEGVLPALPQIQRLLGVAPQLDAELANDDLDANRIGPVDTA
ncbi:helix-turn-helix domain-containing protein [Stenotrophomonas forensis]|uniref:helix-turn-helix domain-containing protein n=1 Tax=Stenotrophomonas forensis TaxID=2871169 RepID=UPI0039C6C7C0